jgi:alginate production protein
MIRCDWARLAKSSTTRAVTFALATASLTAVAPGTPLHAGEPASDMRSMTDQQEAQFQLPPPVTTEPGQQPAPPPTLPQRLQYEYRIGSESDATYSRNADLDKRLKDDFLLLRPEVNAFLVYRPTDWLETKVGLILDHEYLADGERQVTLPTGETISRRRNRTSFRVDEAFFTVHNVTDPFSLTFGRRNFEDARHWLYDTSMDVGIVGFRSGRLQVEATAGREIAWDLDAFQHELKDRTNTYMLYADYRAFEGITFAGYTITRDDRTGQDGRGRIFGLRSIGFPDDRISYWVDAAIVRGHDQTSQSLQGYGFDVGATYRFIGVPFAPNITLAYAFGSGDKNPNDNKNHEFRQSGLQSNESRFAGLSEFKYYGEALDPELSNLKIVTLGVGFRPFQDTSVDFIYHRYRLDEFAEVLRNTAITAEMNQDPATRSRDVGEALDIVIGFRNVFGIRRLGVDLRAGRFFPGNAFRNSFVDAEGNETFEKPNTSTAVVLKLWW